MTLGSGFIRNSLAMLVIGLALLLAIVISALVLISSTQDSFNRLIAERRIRSVTSDLFSQIQDAETGQRGYVLTMKPEFLKPYNEALAKLPKTEEMLSSITQGRPEYEGDVKALFGLVDTKLTELKSTVELGQNGQMDEVRRIVEEGFGKRVMDNIRDRVAAITATTDKSIQTNVSAQQAGSQQLRWITILAGVAIIAVVSLAIFIINRHIASLSAARREVMQLNDELELRVANRTEDLLRANQEIQRFAYIVTHDLRAPLVNIMGFSSELEMSLKHVQAYVLADGAPLNDSQIQEARLAAAEDLPEALSFIRASIGKMDRLINAILKISREGRRQLKAEPIVLRDMLEASRAALHHLIDEAGGEIDIKCPSITISNDRLSLEQIFTNLMENAVKYRSLERALKVTISVSRVGPMMEAEIIDNGRGVAEEDLERIFELFRRAGKQDQPGEGMGLAHVRSLARNLGGDITVRSVLGQGSTFTLRIPADLSQVLRSTSA